MTAAVVALLVSPFVSQLHSFPHSRLFIDGACVCLSALARVVKKTGAERGRCQEKEFEHKHKLIIVKILKSGQLLELPRQGDCAHVAVRNGNVGTS